MQQYAQNEPWDKTGFFLAVLALVLYCSTTSLVPVPGEPSKHLYAYSGLDPFPSLLYPLWGQLVRLLMHMGTNLSYTVGISSAIFGAGCIWAFYSLMSHAQFDYLRSGEAPYTGFYCGVVSSLYLMVSVPFWIAATRSHHLTFHILLLLLFLVTMTKYGRTGKPLHLAIAGFLLGLGVAEFPTMIVLVPPAGIYMALACRRHQMLDVRTLIPAIALFFVGLSLYGVAVMQFMLHPAHAWVGQPSALGGLWMILNEQLLQLRMVSVEAGWTLVVLCALVPWLLAFIAARQNPEGEEKKGSLVVYSVLLLLTCALLLQREYTPFLAYYQNGLLLVSPYLLVAATSGYAIAYGYARLIHPRSKKRTGSIMNVMWVTLPVLAFFTTMATMNYRWIDSTPAKAIQKWSHRVVSGLQPNSWIVTQEDVKDLLGLASYDLDTPLQLIDMSQATRRAYRHYISSCMEDPDVRNLAKISIGAALRHWAQTDPQITQKLTYVFSGDPWLKAGLIPLPEFGRYRGANSDEYLPVDRILKANTSYWELVLPGLIQQQYQPGYVGQLAARLVQHSALVANDAGVFLERRGHTEPALRAYETARQADPNNTSALLNLHHMLGQLGHVKAMATLWPYVEQSLQTVNSPDAIEALELEQGRLAAPTALAPLPTAWNAGLPKEGVRRGFTQVAALLSTGKTPQAFAVAQQLTEDSPTSSQAWVLRGLLAYQLDNQDDVQQVIRSMQSETLDWVSLPIALGDMALLKGDRNEARTFWEQALIQHPNNPALLENLVRLSVTSDDAATTNVAATYGSKLLAVDPVNAIGNYVAGLKAYETDNLEVATTHFERSIENRATASAHHNLAWVFERADRSEEALQHVTRAIEIDPSEADYWSTLTLLLANNGQYDESETARAIAHSLDDQIDTTVVQLAQNQPPAISPTNTLDVPPSKQIATKLQPPVPQEAKDPPAPIVNVASQAQTPVRPTAENQPNSTHKTPKNLSQEKHPSDTIATSPPKTKPEPTALAPISSYDEAAPIPLDWD